MRRGILAVALSLASITQVTWARESNTNCPGALSRLGAKIRSSARFAKEVAKGKASDFKHSGGLSLTGRLPTPKEVIDPNDEVLWGFFTAHRPKEGDTFWSGFMKNFPQLIPRYVMTPVLRVLLRLRHTPDTRYNMTAISGLYRHFTRFIFGTKLYEKSKFYNQEFVPNWITDLAMKSLNPASPVGAITGGLALYFAFFDPFHWFLLADQKIEDYADESRFEKLIEWDPRFADLKAIRNSRDRLLAARSRYAELSYFRQKLLMLANRPSFFKDAPLSTYTQVMKELQSEGDAKSSLLEMNEEMRTILDRFDLAGVSEFQFIQDLLTHGARSVHNRHDSILGEKFPLYIRMMDEERFCTLNCGSEASVAATDKIIRSQIRGFLYINVLDAILFPKDSSLKELKDYAVLAKIREEIEKDPNFKLVKKQKADVFLKRAVLIQYFEWKSRREALEATGFSYKVRLPGNRERSISDSEAMVRMLQNYNLAFRL
jgi:hypothetical protein